MKIMIKKHTDLCLKQAVLLTKVSFFGLAKPGTLELPDPALPVFSSVDPPPTASLGCPLNATLLNSGC